MTTLILIRGLPLSGKSALAKKFKGFLHLENGQHLPAGKVTEQQIVEAEAKTLADTQVALSKGFDVVVSNCFSKVSYMYPFIAAAMAFNAGVQIFEALKQHRATLDFTAEEMETYRIEFESILSVLGPPSTPAQIRARKAEEARLAKIEKKREERTAKKAMLVGQQDVVENKAIVEAQVDHALKDVSPAQAEEIRSIVRSTCEAVYASELAATSPRPATNFAIQSLAADSRLEKLKRAALNAGAKLQGDMVVFDTIQQLLQFQTDNIDLLYPPNEATTAELKGALAPFVGQPNTPETRTKMVAAVTEELKRIEAANGQG